MEEAAAGLGPLEVGTPRPWVQQPDSALEVQDQTRYNSKSGNTAKQVSRQRAVTLSTLGQAPGLHRNNKIIQQTILLLQPMPEQSLMLNAHICC